MPFLALYVSEKRFGRRWSNKHRYASYWRIQTFYARAHSWTMSSRRSLKSQLCMLGEQNTDVQTSLKSIFFEPFGTNIQSGSLVWSRTSIQVTLCEINWELRCAQEHSFKALITSCRVFVPFLAQPHFLCIVMVAITRCCSFAICVFL